MSAPCRVSTKQPLNIPDPELMAFVIERVREGWEVIDILDDLTAEYFSLMPSGMRHDRRDTWRRIIKSAIEAPHHWDPAIDEVAVERAFDGDQEVWVNLSIYERAICLDKLVYVYEHTKPHRQWPHLPSRDGVSAWAAKVGEPHDRIPNISHKRRSRARAAAARKA